MRRVRERSPYPILFALWLLVFSVTSQTMILAPILPRISEQLKVPESRLGMLVTGYAVAVAVVAVLMGPISDRFGRRRMLLFGSMAMTAGLALHGLAGGYASLLMVRIFTGAGGGVLTGATAAYVGDYFPHERRGWANGWIMSGMAVGQILGLPLGTVLAARSGFRLPFLVFAATMGVACVLVWRLVPQPNVHRVEERFRMRRFLDHYAATVAKRDRMAAIAAFLGIFLGTSLYILYLPTWLERARGATSGQIAWLFALGGVGTVLAGPRAGKLSDRIGRKRLVIGCSLAAALVMLSTTAIVTEVWLAYLLFFALTALFAARSGPFEALMTEIVPDEERGSLMSLAMALGQVGSGAGAAIAGAAYGTYGYRSNTVLAAVVVLVVAGLVWRFIAEPAGVARPGDV